MSYEAFWPYIFDQVCHRTNPQDHAPSRYFLVVARSGEGKKCVIPLIWYRSFTVQIVRKITLEDAPRLNLRFQEM